MQMRNFFGLVFLPLFFAFCPSLSAVSYTWNFAGNGGTNCTPSGTHPCGGNAGNTMNFISNGVTVNVSAWYLNGSGTLMSSTLGQYSSGLGSCYPTETCVGSEQEIGNNGDDEFLLFQFSKPINPTSITLTSPTGGGMDVSYWLGSTNGSVDLTNMDVTTSLSTLGFGLQNNGTASVGTNSFGGLPTTSVNAVLFGAATYGSSGDDFEISGISGLPVAGSLPEPTSIFLLFTVAVATVWKLRRRSQQSER